MFHLVRPDLKEEHIDLFYKASIHVCEIHCLRNRVEHRIKHQLYVWTRLYQELWVFDCSSMDPIRRWDLIRWENSLWNELQLIHRPISTSSLLVCIQLSILLSWTSLSKLNLGAPFQTYIYTPLSNYYSSSYASVITNIMIYIQLVLVLFQV